MLNTAAVISVCRVLGSCVSRVILHDADISYRAKARCAVGSNGVPLAYRSERMLRNMHQVDRMSG